MPSYQIECRYSLGQHLWFFPSSQGTLFRPYPEARAKGQHWHTANHPHISNRYMIHGTALSLISPKSHPNNQEPFPNMGGGVKLAEEPRWVKSEHRPKRQFSSVQSNERPLPAKNYSKYSQWVTDRQTDRHQTPSRKLQCRKIPTAPSWGQRAPTPGRPGRNCLVPWPDNYPRSLSALIGY